MNLLEQDIMYLPGVGPHRKELIERELGLKSWGDLISYYPYKHVDRTRIYKIAELSGDMPFVQISGRILSYEEFAGKGRSKRLVAHVGDGSGVADIVWFRPAKYITDTYKVGTEYIVFGRPQVYAGRWQFAHPDIEETSKIDLANMGLQPYYFTTERMKQSMLTSRAIEKIIKALLQKVEGQIPETIPAAMLQRLNMINRGDALRAIHYPLSTDELQKATERLKFEELFFVQLGILRYVSDRRLKYRGSLMPRVGSVFREFYSHHLPFELTNAQKRVMHEIQDDMRSGRQMNRLLQGDVGSGKTLVALMTMLLAIDNGFQACIMAPTEILAEQHLATIQNFLGDMPMSVELLTGVVKGRQRRKVLENTAAGNVNILVGTHALIEDTVVFARLGVAVIDEQHRFGVAQRAKLWNKSERPPHILVMTATPIPRTLAMTLYGDLDVSIIDELPPGRKPIATIHRYDDQTVSLYRGIRREVAAGRQVYVVFPLITESEKIDLKNLEEGYNRLSEALPDIPMGRVHGRMKAQDKEQEMQRFVAGETKILVATTVIEVGVNVPNASVMVIMDAQRFGLSQLHQLRGRVGRGAEQSYCILVTPRKLADDTRRRIDIMCDTTDGFRIAEADLKLRGPGDLEGTQQSGMAFDLKIANIARDGQLVSLARREAAAIIEKDPHANRPENAMLWQHLQDLRRTNINWGAIS